MTRRIGFVATLVLFLCFSAVAQTANDQVNMLLSTLPHDAQKTSTCTMPHCGQRSVTIARSEPRLTNSVYTLTAPQSKNRMSR
jgi:hypothetical protein